MKKINWAVILALNSILALVCSFNANAIQIGADTDLQAPSGQGGTQKTVNVPRVYADLNLGGIVYQDFTARTTTGTSIETLTSITIPANTINAGGRGLKITVWGTTAATANNKTVDIKLGSTTLYTTGAVAANAKTWKLTCYVWRTTSAAVGQTVGEGLFNDAVVLSQWAATTEDFSTALVLAIRATDGTAAGGTLMKGWQVEQF